VVASKIARSVFVSTVTAPRIPRNRITPSRSPGPDTTRLAPFSTSYAPLLSTQFLTRPSARYHFDFDRIPLIERGNLDDGPRRRGLPEESLKDCVHQRPVPTHIRNINPGREDIRESAALRRQNTLEVLEYQGDALLVIGRGEPCGRVNAPKA
jgi:hypothetical protein